MDGTAPDKGRRAGGVVLIVDLAVARLVIGVLLLVVLLRAVGVGTGAVVLELRQFKQIIRGAGHITGRVGPAAGVVAVLGYGFHNGPQIGRHGRQQGIGRRAGGCSRVAQQGPAVVTVRPPSGVGVAGVH